MFTAETRMVFTPLTIAAKEGYEDIVQELLDKDVFVIVAARCIDTVDLNGGGQQVLFYKVVHAYNLAISRDLVYWTDWQKTTVYSCKRMFPFPTSRIWCCPNCCTHG